VPAQCSHKRSQRGWACDADRSSACVHRHGMIRGICSGIARHDPWRMFRYHQAWSVAYVQVSPMTGLSTWGGWLTPMCKWGH